MKISLQLKILISSRVDIKKQEELVSEVSWRVVRDTNMQDAWNCIKSKGVRAARNTKQEEEKLKIKACKEELAR